ncbi:N-6 DNA methylase [Thermococcus sp. 21S7]|uniref:Eco57I restriction-modification methylase domain-containing protein n=1 Tax=Thermococcus sp. 21S7 TaxID=1638221 RepID=UPI00143C3F09|nr:N-6 DNA methylase [Thermococcus sp. 21S7]NJE60723.1 hypothetical protein [Thermococcus sp. 21S7]
MGEVGTLNKVKTLGQVHTPGSIAEFMARWAVRTPRDTILEPSCGDGIFLEASIWELLSRGARLEDIPRQVYGVELDWEMIEETKKRLLSKFGVVPTLINSDFFDLQPLSPQLKLVSGGNRLPPVDVVIGNPPYIRYQLFKGKTRRKAMSLSNEEGVNLTELTASWVPFVIHAGSFLKDGGRMAMVLPSKLLHVNYAKSFRKWLLKNFKSVILVSFEKRAFSVLEDTIILLGIKGHTKTSEVKFVTVRSEERLGDIKLLEDFSGYPSFSPKADEKWTKYLLPPDILREYLRIVERVEDMTTTVGELGKVTIGVVTGDNSFFTLSVHEAERWNIEREYLVPLVSRAEHLKGTRITAEDWKLLCKLGQKCYLLHVTEPWENLPQHVKEYLNVRGEELRVRDRYKVKIRKRWYEVPGVRFPDIFMSYMIHDIPKISANEVRVDGNRATSTNTIHHIFLRRNITPILFATSFYNSLTLASLELNGRFYGGGVLKVEPKEVEKIMLPKIKNTKELLRAGETVDRLLRKRKINDVVELIDEILLEGELGLHRDAVEIITNVWERLRKNRIKKSKS